MAEEFDGRVEVFGGHAVEMAVGGKETVGGEDVEGFGGGVEEMCEELAAFAEDAA